MTIKSQASRRYAVALVESLSASKLVSLDEALTQLTQFSKTLDESFELKNLLLNPAFAKQERDKSLEGLLQHLKVSDPVARFIRLLVENRRITEVDEITEAFRDLADERRGRLRATVHSAAALSPDTEDRLRRALEKKTGRSIDLETHVDPSLIGGLRARVGSLVFDGTIRTELDRLKDQLSQGE